MQAQFGTPFKTWLRLSDFRERGEGSAAMLQSVSDFLASPTAFLTIHGRNGNGKSTFLQALTNELLERRVMTLYMSAADMMEFLKAGIGDDDYDVESRLSALSTVPVLFIDEISGINFTEWVQEKFGVLIDRRYRLELGTVLALDDDPCDILHRRIMSRLREGVIIENTDPDMRPLLGMR